MFRLGSIAILFCAVASSAQGQGPTWQSQLAAEGPKALAAAALREGDARRGAIVFHQPSLACTKCHSVGLSSVTGQLGPDLTRPEPNTTAEFLMESILDPSKVLRKGFEPVVVQLSDGKTVTGLFVEESDDKLVLRDAARLGETIAIPKSQIEERAIGRASLMPAGQVNVLATRQQFLDLARYVIEIAEGGPERARQLQPPPSLFTFVVPEYERQIDHAGMLKDLDAGAFKRGEAIYNRLCINCHGTREQPGSLPASLRFAEGKFKNGADPFRMYQTLTHGFNLMTPQTWMVPQQKYDVIHYVREAYLKPHNSSQYVSVDANYLASLPSGNSRGPAPSNFEPWSAMNYGPTLMATYEVGQDGSNFAYKGIATRLDPGPGGVSRGRQWLLFDHETLRMAAAWSSETAGKSTVETPNFIDWHGINFDGRHQIHPRLSGVVHWSNPAGPGWADPASGSFEDPRIEGRDHKRYGPLPRSWGRYRGLYHYGDQVIVSYTVGDTSILEMPGVVPVSMGTEGNGDTRSDVPVTSAFTRMFQIGPRTRPLVMKVASAQTDHASLAMLPVARSDQKPVETVALVTRPADSKQQSLTFNGRTQVHIERAQEFDLTESDFTISARVRTRAGGTIFCQAPPKGPWKPDGKSLFIRGGRLVYDIGWVGAVSGKSNVADDRWHDVVMTWQHKTGMVRLFVDGKPDGQGILKPKAKAVQQTIRIGFTSQDFPDPTFFTGQFGDLQFLQRAITDEEVGGIQSGTVQNRDKLRSHWKLDRGAEALRDITGHGHDGTTDNQVESNLRSAGIAAGLSPTPAGSQWSMGEKGSLLLSLPEGPETLTFVLAVASAPDEKLDANLASALSSQAPLDLRSLTRGGPRRWLDELETVWIEGPDNGPFAVDVLSIPSSNPWFAQLRLTGFDFYADGNRMAVCSWDGDVWLVSGLRKEGTDSRRVLKWRRIASGLYQPLGLRIVDEQIHVACRDQITILRDLNQDGETDFYECLNSDHQVTEHFHEFAMGLQTDNDGNFYYAKSARHALPAIVPHHGTLLRVSKDGSRTEIIANGFRAANGVCLNPDGTFVVTDQEGHWNPKNRINWVTPPKPGERPRFYGNMFGYHDITDASDRAMEPPLCWITNSFDRSPAELLWVTSDKWGPLKGSLLNLSYGYGKIFVVPFEQTGQGEQRMTQGGMCELPLPVFPTGILRGRFHPMDGHLYTCGMFAWAGNATQPGGMYRVRATGRPMHLPIGLSARTRGIQIRFTEELDPAGIEASQFTVRTWSLRRTADYGSRHHDEKSLKIASVSLSDDRRTINLEIPEIQTTWCMSIEYKLRGADGTPVQGLIHNTIHALNE